MMRILTYATGFGTEAAMATGGVEPDTELLLEDDSPLRTLFMRFTNRPRPFFSTVAAAAAGAGGVLDILRERSLSGNEWLAKGTAV
jgi:hypothetical protein